VGCGDHHFTCSEKCGELRADPSLGLPLPRPLSCGANDSYSMKELLGWRRPVPLPAAADVVALQQRSALLWQQLRPLLHEHAPSGVGRPPGGSRC
jgi:hypothetical protein